MKKSVQKEATLAEAVSYEIHAIPIHDMLPTEKEIQTTQDMVKYFAQMEDDIRHKNAPNLPLPKHYPTHTYFKPAPLHAFFTQILP